MVGATIHWMPAIIIIINTNGMKYEFESLIISPIEYATSPIPMHDKNEAPMNRNMIPIKLEINAVDFEILLSN